MSEATPEETPTEGTQEPAAAASTPPADPKPEPPKSEPESGGEKSSPWSDPKAAEAEIKRLRQEAADRRVAAKSAEEARSDLAQQIGKVLGLVEDDATDPAKLTESLTQAQSEAQQARVELAVYRAADTAGGDPAALLDSTSFLKSLDGIDPSDSAAVTEAITKAVEANSRLGAAPGTPKAPAPNPAQGTSGTGAPSVDQLIQDAQQKGDWRTALTLQNQKLAEAAEANK